MTNERPRCPQSWRPRCSFIKSPRGSYPSPLPKAGTIPGLHHSAPAPGQRTPRKTLHALAIMPGTVPLLPPLPSLGFSVFFPSATRPAQSHTGWHTSLLPGLPTMLSLLALTPIPSSQQPSLPLNLRDKEGRGDRDLRTRPSPNTSVPLSDVRSSSACLWASGRDSQV